VAQRRPDLIGGVPAAQLLRRSRADNRSAVRRARACRDVVDGQQKLLGLEDGKYTSRTKLGTTSHSVTAAARTARSAGTSAPSVPMMMRQTPAGVYLGGIDKHPVVMPQIKDSKTLAAAGAETIVGLRPSPYQRRLLRRLNFWTVPVAAHSRARQVAHPCGGRPRGGRPRAVGAIVRREGLYSSALSDWRVSAPRRDALSPAKRGPKTLNQPAGGGTCAFAAGEPPAEQRWRAPKTIIESKKTVAERGPLWDRNCCALSWLWKGAAVHFWWRVTP